MKVNPCFLVAIFRKTPLPYIEELWHVLQALNFTLKNWSILQYLVCWSHIQLDLCDPACTNAPPSFSVLRPSSWMNPNFRTPHTLLESLAKKGQLGNKDPMRKNVLFMHHPFMVVCSLLLAIWKSSDISITDILKARQEFVLHLKKDMAIIMSSQFQASQFEMTSECSWIGLNNGCYKIW